MLRLPFPSVPCLVAGAGILIAACSPRGSGSEMQAARALELGRDQEAFQLLEPLVGPSFESAPDDSAFAATLSPARLPHVAREHVLFARACLRTERTMRGVRSAARAVVLEPRDPEAHLVKALLDQRRYRNVAAVAAAREAARLAPEDARIRLALGELLLGGGMVGTPDFDGAAAELREALRLDPENRRARFVLAKTLIVSGNSEEGDAALDSLLAEGRAPAEARFLRGLTRLRRRDFAGAIEEFRLAVRLEPTRSASWFNLANALEREGKSAEAVEIRRRFDAALDLENEMRSLEVAFHSSEDNLAPALRLADLLVKCGRADKALGILETVTFDHPDDTEAALLLSEAALREHDSSRAETAARRAVELAPGNADAFVALSNALALNDRSGDALANARNAVDAAPASSAAHATLGRRLLESGDAVAALRELQVARQIDPNDPELLGDIGMALARAEAWEEAEQAFGAAMAALGPRDEWLVERGLVRAAMGRPGWAADDFRLALAANPDEPRAAQELARAYRAMNRESAADSAAGVAESIARRAKATKPIREALRADPRNTERAERLARVLEENGRPDEAALVLARAFEPGVEP